MGVAHPFDQRIPDGQAGMYVFLVKGRFVKSIARQHAAPFLQHFSERLHIYVLTF